MNIIELKAILWVRYQDAQKRGAVSRATAYMEVLNLLSEVHEVDGVDYKQATLG